jgi:folylpolyglutamate synthase/dihydropteroate synthase
MNRRAVGVREAADHLERAGVEVRWVDAGTDPRTQDIAISRALFEEVARRHQLGEVATRHAIEAGVRRCRWPGRQEVVVTPSGTWWVDGAHNPNGIAAARDWLRQLLRQAGLETVDAVVGVSPDRDAANLLRPLRPYVTEVTATAAVGAKATPVEQLEQALRGEGFAVRRAASLCEAVLTPSTRPRLLIGSLYLVGSAFDAWGFSAESLRVYDASA